MHKAGMGDGMLKVQGSRRSARLSVVVAHIIEEVEHVLIDPHSRIGASAARVDCDDMALTIDKDPNWRATLSAQSIHEVIQTSIGQG